MAIVSKIGSLLISELPSIIDGIVSFINRAEKEQSFQQEEERHEQIRKAIKEDDEELARKTMADMLSNIRRNVD